jgi:hypothetical protein
MARSGHRNRARYLAGINSPRAGAFAADVLRQLRENEAKRQAEREAAERAKAAQR